jgi:catechol 2,3-dioxygenase-like lactoylglutathione lyase family enzyme
VLIYTTIGTQNLPRAVAFYDAVFAVLKQPRQAAWSEEWVSWGGELDQGFGFCICPTFNGERASVGNGTMFAFRADSAEQVRLFHSAGLAHGGTDEGSPGTRKIYGPEFYVAYLRDPDGNKLACVFPRFDGSRDEGD